MGTPTMRTNSESSVPNRGRYVKYMLAGLVCGLLIGVQVRSSAIARPMARYLPGADFWVLISGGVVEGLRSG
jgi:hypothetical protein